jgi:hypothetical protein
MEYLFSTHIEHQPYRVVFDKEKYIFLPDADDDKLKSFSVRRTHDEWMDDGLSEQTRKEAIEALDRYLMKQH